MWRKVVGAVLIEVDTGVGKVFGEEIGKILIEAGKSLWEDE